MNKTTSKAVNPLNFADDQAYIASFHRSAPKRLGIAIDICWKEGEANAFTLERPATQVAIGATTDLLESKPFQQKYFPPEVDDFQLQLMGTTTIERFWDRFPNVASKWKVDGISIIVSFYDAGDNAIAPMELGFGVAMIALQECIADSGSVDPSTHVQLHLTRSDALDHMKTIGSLYEDHMGVWCESLVPLWNTLMNRFYAYLKSIPAGGLLALIEETNPGMKV